MPIAPHELDRALRTLKTRGAPGSDGLSPWMLKHGGDEGKAAILALLSFLWRHGVWPPILSEGIVSYIKKPGAGKSAINLDHCRPITLLQVVAKLMESILQRRLARHIEDGGLFNDAQTGFREGRSTIDNLFILTETMRQRATRDKDTVLVFIDIKSAYDRIDRNLLFDVLAQRMGVHGRLYRILHVMFERVPRCVRVEQFFSKWFNLDLSVPQGSVLSPLLFNILVNEVARALEAAGLGTAVPGTARRLFARLYADDIVLVLHHPDRVNDALRLLGEVGDRWRLKFSGAKTKVVLVTTSAAAKAAHAQRSWTLQEQRVEAAAEWRYLGVHLGLLLLDDAGNFVGLDWSSTVAEKIKSVIYKAFGLRSEAGPLGHATWAGGRFFKQLIMPSVEFALEVMDITMPQLRMLSQATVQALRYLLVGSTRNQQRFTAPFLLGEVGMMDLLHRVRELRLRFFRRLSYVGTEYPALLQPNLLRDTFRVRRSIFEGRHWARGRLAPRAIDAEVQAIDSSSICLTYLADCHYADLDPPWRPLAAAEPGEDPPSSTSARLAWNRQVRQALWIKAAADWRRKSALSMRRGGGKTGFEFVQRGPHPSGFLLRHGNYIGRYIKFCLRAGCLPVAEELHRLDRARYSNHCDLCLHARLHQLPVTESGVHFVLDCPSLAAHRGRLFHDLAVLLIDYPLVGRLLREPDQDPTVRLAILLDPGAPTWPRAMPAPEHATLESLPILGRALAELPHSVRVRMHSLVTAFLVDIWFRRAALLAILLGRKEEEADALCLLIRPIDTRR